MTGKQGAITTRDLAIAVLGVTAVILLVALLAANALLPRQALAAGQTAEVGNFLVSTARLDETAELLMILNKESGLMNAYGFNVHTGQIELIQQVDLERLTRDMERFRREQRERLDRQPGREQPGQRSRH
ncbi:MAG TPA: hypothetical protein VLM89_17545 [Phycisphaerae bacterium]|nr:hypothetical protein [Phycisphaerae bacterium]